jgi:DNA-binding XRE family transcriptional regulator
VSIIRNNASFHVSEDEILYLDKILEDINTNISVSMSYVKRTQNLTFPQLAEHFSGINEQSIKRYMQQSYPSMRPLHFVAAYSWVMMVPMTAFYYGFKMKEFYRGMGQHAVEALVCIGKLPSVQFDALLSIICSYLDESSVAKFMEFKQQTEEEYCIRDNYNALFPPSILDIDAFSHDYYRSVALTVKQFREEHQISVGTMARVLGLSEYQYHVLEDEDKMVPFSISIGVRVKLGFKLKDHVNFTSAMQVYPEFHKLRQAQHVRDSLVVEALRFLSPKQKKSIVRIVIELMKSNQEDSRRIKMSGLNNPKIPTIFS